MASAVHRRVLGGLIIAVLAAGAAGCQTGEAPAGTADEGPLAVADGPGSVSGRITFVGTPPPRQEIRVSSDPSCVTDSDHFLSETLIVGQEGGLENVFVYVKDGLGDRRYATPETPIVLDQVGCRYTPHVFGVQVGQTVEVRNSDPTLHNVHATTKTGNYFNFGQMAGGPPSDRLFKEQEVMVPVRCDVHGWMIAYAGVVTHPYFAVSDEAGAFEIRGLPPGTYTIEAWHERLGTQTQTLTIAEAEPTATLDFAFQEQ